MARRRWWFGACLLDVEARELLVDGQPVELEPRTLAVLVYLIEHRDRTVPKEELLDSIWGDRFVGESALTSQIKVARSAIGDDGRTQGMIKTVHRVGYRFIGDVVEQQVAGRGEGRGGESGRSLSAGWSSPPSKAVLGRDADLHAVRARLADHRVVTLTGPAGVGKTSLARALLDDPGGRSSARWFCELGDTRDPDAIANVVLTA
ncbi:MAG: winged helix-turn-helix domain-containing protein, partial [Acidimicrobiales bacterium]|nr:winged helix-turn-helix domain-containing protein [Acidimicrobiales bacterium]